MSKHPTASLSPSTAATKEPKAQSIGASTLAKNLGLGTHNAAGQLLAGQVKPEWIDAAGEGWHVPDTLMWPVRDGWYARGYGSGEASYHLAVDIMGKLGAAVRAAAPGIVAYSGDNVTGYGNMVMLIHPGGWVTIYAHNTSILVSAGERIGTGRLLALLGSTGISRGPHVHFEFVYKGKNCNPTPLFRPGVRHRYGSSLPINQVVWNPFETRPPEIQCDLRKRFPHSRYYLRHPKNGHHDEDQSFDEEGRVGNDYVEETLKEGASAVEGSEESAPGEKASKQESPAKEIPTDKTPPEKTTE
jgi:hypothetical protein